MTEHEQILIHILNCRRADLYAQELSLTSEQKQQVNEMENRLKAGEPLQYILGTCDFMGLPLKVDLRVLIPRPETEILVEQFLKRAQDLKRRLNILDLGTGSGNIAIALAKFLDDAQVTTVDISADSLALAKENAELHDVDSKIDFIHQDMVSYLREQIAEGSTFDIIVSNPPYIATADMARLPADVQREPKAALEAGEDGLLYSRPIIEAASVLLESDGFLMMEIGDKQDNALKEFCSGYNEIRRVEFIKDYTEVNRIIVVSRNNPQPVNRCFKSAVRHG